MADMVCPKCKHSYANISMYWRCPNCATIHYCTQSTSTNSDLMQLLTECVDYMYGVSGRSLKGDSLINQINAVLAQQH